MYRIEFYEDKNGVSEVFDLLIDLEEKSKTSKDARIQHNQILAHIDKLRQNGTYNPSSVTKKIKGYDDLWELRPGNNRIFYFYYKDNTFVLLHCFKKKSQLTPRKEIKIALSRKNDYIARKERMDNENI